MAVCCQVFVMFSRGQLREAWLELKWHHLKPTSARSYGVD